MGQTATRWRTRIAAIVVIVGGGSSLVSVTRYIHKHLLHSNAHSLASVGVTVAGVRCHSCRVFLHQSFQSDFIVYACLGVGGGVG